MSFLARATPLLNKLIPAGLGLKALSKIDPKMSKFISNAGVAGFSADTIIDYLRNRIAPASEVNEKRQLEQGMQKGNLHPEQVASRNKRRDEDLIAKGISGLTGLGAGLTGLGGGQEEGMSMSQPPSVPPPAIPPTENEMTRRNTLGEFNKIVKRSKSQESQMQPGMRESIMRQYQQHYGPIGGDSQQGGNSEDQAIIDALSKILSL